MLNYAQLDALPNGKRFNKPWWHFSYWRIVRCCRWLLFRIAYVWSSLFSWENTVREYSRLIERKLTRCKNLRHLFVNNDIMRLYPMRVSHSHPTAASYRSAVNIYMNDIVKAKGYKPYNVSCSATDRGPGSRYFYGLKDLAIPFQDDEITDEHVLIMCDVDYYTDMNKWLSYFRPILMYTFTPTKCVGRTKDYAYRLVDGHVEFHVAGGSSYRHKLWGYTGDVVSTVREEDDTLLVFNIEQREIPGDEFHRYIAITPMVSVPAPYHWWLKDCDRYPLERLCFDQGEYNVLYEPVRDTISVAANGAWQCVTLQGKVYEAIKQRIANKTSPPVVSDIERLMRAAGDEDAACNAPLIFNMMNLDLRKNVVITNGVVSSFQPLGSLITEDGKPSGTQISPPLVSEPAVFPVRGVCADEATIRGRIDAVKNVKVPPREYKQYAEEFVDLVVIKSGRGCPLSFAEVQKLQATVQQRARTKVVQATLTTNVINRLQAFIKAEPYANVTDPRNITTMAPELTIMMSAYTYGFKQQVLKNVHWFGPGKNPNQTIKALSRLQANGKDWLAIDYSRLDGTVSEFLQKHVMFACYMRWASPEYRPELDHLLKQVFIQSGTTATGLKFKPGWGTRSGSPCTTDGNTLICAYVLYCALRNLGYEKQEAFDKIGLVYGDDGEIGRAHV